MSKENKNLMDIILGNGESTIIKIIENGDRNFYEDIIRGLQQHDKSGSDVIFCGWDGGYIDWKDFKKLADFNYDHDDEYEQYGIAGFYIVGDNWYMEYDEFTHTWMFREMPAYDPSRPPYKFTLKHLVCNNEIHVDHPPNIDEIIGLDQTKARKKQERSK